MSMLRERNRAARHVPMLLVYSSRTWEDVIFRDELVAAHALRNGFDLVLATTRGPRGRTGDFERRLDAGLVASILAAWGHAPRTAYVCGADAFVEAMAKRSSRRASRREAFARSATAVRRATRPRPPL
jgi:ferredoxin-NADP reductase